MNKRKRWAGEGGGGYKFHYTYSEYGEVKLEVWGILDTFPVKNFWHSSQRKVLNLCIIVWTNRRFTTTEQQIYIKQTNCDQVTSNK